MTSKLTESLSLLLSKYRELPYVAVKRHTKFYLIPHRPLKPEHPNFKIMTKKIQTKSDKYNQYFSLQKIRTKQLPYQQAIAIIKSTGVQPTDTQQTQKISETPIQSESLLVQKIQFENAIEQYLTKSREYDYKYKEPLNLMSLNPYRIFIKEEARQIKLNLQNSPSQLQSSDLNMPNSNTPSLKTPKPQKLKSGTERSESNIHSINQHKLPAKWRALTEEQKLVYTEMQTKIKQANQKRIQQFIQKHQIPFQKKFSVISRFTTRYAPIHQLSIKDKKLYEIYHGLPASQREMLKNEAIKMNKESKQRYQHFLNKWDLSEEVLKQIIEVSVEYKKARRIKSKETRKKNIAQKNKFYEEEEDQDLDSEDYDIDQS